MACVNEKGQLTESAKKLFRAIGNQSLTPAEISKSAGIPLFKVRSSLREMTEAEYIAEESGQYRLTSKAIELLEKQ